MKLTLKAIRINYGLTQEQAAKAIGVATKTWFSYENGKTSPRNNTVKLIGRLFNVNPNDILFHPKVQFNCNKLKEGVNNG